ncbi:IS701 family transposase [Kitasatospora viridis]|uniref:SRSO17 transposase n=1 Tax=Kitasatospora viridis TaxID=281105 RepID=A0A561UMF1_9ACTN|nr:transposase [Kitasatospora viridis]TWG00504.1 SRSO17 transposase [Kitasatospora viridis]
MQATGVGTRSIDTRSIGTRSIDGDLLADLAEQVFGHLHRADQRRWARIHLIGLLSVSGRKSLREMARAVSGATDSTHGLQQFINSSPWDWKPARDELAAIVEQRVPVRAWTAGILGIPKRGDRSVGVHRRFLPKLGRTVNCQVAAGIFLCSAEQSIPVDWTIFLDEGWDSTESRRRARIPSEVGPQPLCMNVLGLVDAMLARFPGAGVPLVADLRTATDISRLAFELGYRGVEFVAEVAPTQLVQLTAEPRSAGSGPQRPGGATTAADLWDPDGRRHGTTVSSLVRLPGAESSRTPERIHRLLVQRVPGGRSRYWVTSILDRPITEVLVLARHGDRVELALRDLELDYGVADFEGRSYPGWHHHMTMASTAYLYRNLLAPHALRAGRRFEVRGRSA